MPPKRKKTRDVGPVEIRFKKNTYTLTPFRVQKLRELELEFADVCFNDCFRLKSTNVPLPGLHSYMEKFCSARLSPPVVLSKEARKLKKAKRKKDERTFQHEYGMPFECLLSEEQFNRLQTRRVLVDQTTMGRAQALFVDQQCSALLRQEQVPVTSDTFPYKIETFQFWNNEPELAIAKELLPRIHPFVFLIFQLLLDKGFQPISAQLPVLHERALVATAIDQLWWCPTKNRFVLIELKCELSSNFDLCSPFEMTGPFENVPNTPRNRAMVQLALSKQMLERTYPATENCLAYVVRAHSDGNKLAELFELDESILKKSEQCWKYQT